MLLETFAISSTAATALGLNAYLGYNALLKWKASSDGDSLRQETGFKALIQISQEKLRMDMPSYVNVGGTTTGFSLPVGGGLVVDDTVLLEKAVHTEESQSIAGSVITDFRGKSGASLRYLNTADDVDNFCVQHAIPKYSFPIMLPLKAYTITPSPNDTLYVSSKWRLLGSSPAAVARTATKWRVGQPLALASIFAVGSATLIALDWQDQKHRLAAYLRFASGKCS